MADQPTDGKPEKKSNMTMIALIAGGAVVLLCCCTGVCGVGGWYFVTPMVSQAAIVGVWREEMVTFDFRADGKLKKQDFDLVYKFVDANTIEIGPDKSGNNQLNGRPYPTIRYRVERKDDTLTLTEVSTPPPGEQPGKYVLKRR
jgi:hypothetical protein